MAPPIDPSPRGGYGTILSNAIATSATASDISTSYDSDINDHPYHQLPRVPVFGAKLKPPKRRVPQTHLLAGGLLISSLLLAIILVGLERYDRSLSTVDTTHPGMKLQSTLSRPRAATTLSHKRQEEKRSREVTTSSGAVAEADTSLQFEVENRYGKHTYQDSLYPWLDGKKLIETGMGTSLRILDPIDDATYVWTIYYSVDGSEEEAEDEDQLAGSWTGNEISVVLSTPGTYLAVLQALDATEDDKNTLLSTSKETIYVKYVRREIRGLLPIDREAFMDAAHTVWTVSEEEGQKLYGPDYKDIYYFTGYHLTMAGLKYCDHMHDGLGFMTQHVALTMKLEQVLRTINPSVSMPYWDYTIDVEHIDNNLDYEYSDNWFKAEVFTDEYFGEVDPIEHTVTKGRWAYTEVGKSSFDVKNAYGLMRAPWNCNKNKYVTRYSDFCGQSWVGGTENMPSCSTHYNMVAEYNTWDEFGTELPYIPHGTIHSSTGGSFNCDESFNAMKDLGLSDDFLQYYSLWSFGYQRKWYRYDLLTCPTDCSEDTPQSECLCSCDVDKVLSKYDDSLDSVLEALVDVEEYRGEVTALSEDDQRTFVQLVCDAGILVGDHLEAASPADISFWPIHPAIERLWVYKKLKGFFTDEDWPSGSSIYTDCRGHDYNDTIPLAGLMEDPDLYYTNGELYSLMDPSISSLPYIFDNFDWQHCLDQQGIDFSQVEMGVGISSTSSSSSSAVAKARKQRKGQQSRNRRKSAAAH